jgi:pimeloyl-ACP methyl ester carboxylesterase
MLNMWRCIAISSKMLRSSCVLFVLLQSAHAQLALHDCGEAGENVRCGTLTVPENRKIAGGRQLELSIIVVPHTSVGQMREPLFVLKGGPGEAATTDVEDTMALFGAVRPEHDLVLLDQRGTGATRLRCEVADRAFLVPRDPERCLNVLGTKANLRLYTTEDFVEDLDAARAALGYDQISLWGASYGTRAAYVYAKRHSTRVRSLVLIAPAPLSMPLLDSFDQDGRAALDAVAADCAADRACGKAYPTVLSDVKRLRDGLTDRFDLIGLQLLLYSSATARWLPFLASRTAAGDRSPFDTAIQQVRREILPRLSIGLHLAVFCNEDLPFHAPGASLKAPSFLRAEYDVACRAWPQAQLPPDFRVTVRIDKPALLITGEWDPATSPRWARAAADQFSRSQVVVVPKEGHILARVNNCVGIMTREFLERGMADASCALGLKPLPYRLP